MKTGSTEPRGLDVDLPRAAWVAGFLVLAALILRQIMPSRHNKAFLRLDGPANASWLLGMSSAQVCKIHGLYTRARFDSARTDLAAM